MVSNRRTCREWQAVLAAVDTVVILLSIGVTLWLRFGPDAGEYLLRNAFVLSLFFALCFPSFYVVGLYDVAQLGAFPRLLGLSAGGTALSLLMLVMVSYVWMTSPAGRGVAALLFLFVSAGVGMARWCFAGAMARFGFARGLLLVEGEPLTERLCALITANPYLGYRVKKVIRKEEVAQELIGSGADAVALQIEAHPVQVSRHLRAARFAGVEVIDAVELYERLTGEVPLDAVDERYLFEASLRPSLFHMNRIKRLFDIVVASLLVAITCWLWPLIAAAIKIDSRGPVLYRQERSGRNGKVFCLLKFRTMREDAERESGPVWARAGDPRVTMVGRILRRLRLDELPQLLNVLGGSMSMVGPRPERPELVAHLAGEIPFFHDRLLMKPGITGWAQVNYPYAGSVEDSRRKLQFDLYYLKNMSLHLDILILLRTVRIVFTGKGV